MSTRATSVPSQKRRVSIFSTGSRVASVPHISDLGHVGAASIIVDAFGFICVDPMGRVITV